MAGRVEDFISLMLIPDMLAELLGGHSLLRITPITLRILRSALRRRPKSPAL